MQQEELIDEIPSFQRRVDLKQAAVPHDRGELLISQTTYIIE